MNFREFHRLHKLQKPLTEAVFDSQNLDRVMRLYSKLFSKTFGSKFYLLGEESFKKPGMVGYGVRFMNDQGYQLRFNWSKANVRSNIKLNKASKGIKYYIDGIDYWDSGNKDFGCPSSSANFSQSLNVVEIYKKVSKMLKNGIKGKFTYGELVDQHSIQEASMTDVNSDQASRFFKQNGFKSDITYGTKKTQQSVLDNDADLQAKFDEYVLEIQAGKPEKNDFNTSLANAQKALDDIKYCDPELVFKDIESMAGFVGSGGNKSFICCGLGGVGKCIDVDTDVITPNGNLRAGDIKVGDEVITPKNTISKVLKVYPQDSLKECYEVIL